VGWLSKRRQPVTLDRRQHQLGVGAVVDDDRPADQEVRQHHAVRPAGMEQRVDDDPHIVVPLAGLEHPHRRVQHVRPVGQCRALREAGCPTRVEDDVWVALVERHRWLGIGRGLSQLLERGVGGAVRSVVDEDRTNRRQVVGDRRQRRQELTGNDQRRAGGLIDRVLELAGAVPEVDRHHDRAQLRQREVD
jgi:hypothetical protein